MNSKPKKVLIVDDSRYISEYLAAIFSSDHRFEVIGKAADPYEAVKIIADEVPDVISLDIEMPRMSGVKFLKKIMRQHPIPVIVITNQSLKQINAAMEALHAGAVDVISKKDITPTDTDGKRMLVEKMWSAANGKVGRLSFAGPQAAQKGSQPEGFSSQQKIVLMGASSGGTQTITKILSGLPAQIPPVLIVQHIPEQMSFLFARRLNELLPFYVKEAENGDRVRANQVLIAQGNKHMELKYSGEEAFIKISQGPPLNFVRPSVDKLFFSALSKEPDKIVAILLTGMGRDGAHGLLQLKEKGAFTIAQDEASSMIYGMPKAAKDMNAARALMSPEEISRYIRNISAPEK